MVFSWTFQGLRKLLEACGIRATPLNWFQSYFSIRKQYVELDGVLLRYAIKRINEVLGKGQGEDNKRSNSLVRITKHHM